MAITFETFLPVRLFVFTTSKHAPDVHLCTHVTTIKYIIVILKWMNGNLYGHMALKMGEGRGLRMLWFAPPLPPNLSWWWWWRWLFLRLRELRENVRLFIPRLRFIFEVEISLRTLIRYARISPQWLSELRRLWPNVP